MYYIQLSVEGREEENLRKECTHAVYKAWEAKMEYIN